MKQLSFLAALALIGLAQNSRAAGDSPCARFNKLARKTYNFDATSIAGKEQLAKKKQEIDTFWKTVRGRGKLFVPCLRAAVRDPKNNAFQRFDGSNLLVAMEPTLASKSLQIDVYTATDLGLAGAERWLRVLAARGFEGFNISRPAERWLHDPKAQYTVNDQSGYDVRAYEGALFLYGSMQEGKATPALLKIVEQKKHIGRGIALSLLTRQATPEAIAGLVKLDLTDFPAEARKAVNAVLSAEPMIVPNAEPKIGRNELVAALQELDKGNGKSFLALAPKIDEAAKDMVVLLTAEDLPLLRKVRRRLAANGNPAFIEYYIGLTKVILDVMRK